MVNPTKIETAGRVKRTVVAYLNGTALESLDNRQSSESYVLAKFYPPPFLTLVYLCCTTAFIHLTPYIAYDEVHLTHRVFFEELHMIVFAHN